MSPVFYASTMHFAVVTPPVYSSTLKLLTIFVNPINSAFHQIFFLQSERFIHPSFKMKSCPSSFSGNCEQMFVKQCFDSATVFTFSHGTLLSPTTVRLLAIPEVTVVDC